MIYVDIKHKRYLPTDYRQILQKIRSLIKDFSNAEVRDIRISTYFVEIDLSVYNVIADEIVSKIMARISLFGTLLLSDELTESNTSHSKEQTLVQAIFLFNIERFWKSHELLESLWRIANGQEKSILNSIILMDAAYVHLQRGESDIFISILKRALEKLKNVSGSYLFLNLNEIKTEVNEMVKNANTRLIKIKIY
jgi:hypothetical protein